MSAFAELLDEARALAGAPEDDDWRERFYDERDEPERPEFWGQCGNCPEFDRCDIPGHEEVGRCGADGEWHFVTDPDECD